MSEQSKWTVGSALGLGVLLLALFANFNARFDNLTEQIADLRADVRADVRDIRADVRDVRADMRRLDDRLRAVEIAFGKVDQRLLTLERILIPDPDPGAP